MKALVLAIVLAVTAIAHAGDTPETTDGKAYFADGTAAFDRGEYAAASRAFAAGYEIEKWTGFLFAWAQAERKAGNCDKAVKLYSRFISTKPGEGAIEHALGWIKECGGTYTEPPPEPVVVSTDEEKKLREDKERQDRARREQEERERERARAAQRPGFQHKLAIGLGAGALIAGGIATWALVRSGQDFDRAATVGTYKDVVKFRDRGEDRLLLGRITVGVGLGLATATVLRVVLQDRTPRTEVVPTRSGVALRRTF